MCRQCAAPGWLNVYGYFTDHLVWPRGLPLIRCGARFRLLNHSPSKRRIARFSKAWLTRTPDVDAVFRLLFPLPVRFQTARRVALGQGTWCPFNSQNTAWWPEAYELLYLPAYCLFRMTDIWRSLIAQRIAWANGWAILFHEPTMRQERNEHDLMRDFADEIPGYLHNRRIASVLDSLDLSAGVESIAKQHEAVLHGVGAPVAV